MEGNTLDVEIIQYDQLNTAEWAARSDMFLNFGPSPSLTSLFPNVEGTDVSLPPGHGNKGTWSHSSKTTQLRVQVDAVGAKARSMLASSV